MTPERTRRILYIAIALSLLLHFIFALVARWPQPPGEQVAEKISHVHIVRIRHIVPTPPPPVFTPHPPAAIVRHGRVNLPVVSHANTGPAATAQAVQTPPPTPKPLASGENCVTRNAPAAKATAPPPPDIAPDVRSQGVSGTTSVLVQLDARGNVVNASVTTSSGSESLDAAALAMARNTTYTPAIENCKAVASNYTFTARWLAW